MFWELPSLQVPFALNCKVDPGARSELLGVTEIELSVAELTVSGVIPVAVEPAKLKVALMLALPWPEPNATPVVEFIDTTEELSELQVTELLMSWVEESLKRAVAVKIWCQPTGMVWFTGVTVTELIVALVTL